MTTAISQLPAVVVLRSGHHGGLGIMRSLGRLGVPVYAVDADRWESGFSSRYCRGRFVFNTAAVSPEQSIAWLLETGHRIGGRPILIPTTDSGAIWVAENAAALEECYSMPQQDPTLLRLLSDKSRMQALARQNGVPTPQSMVPRSREDVDRYLDTAVFPVIAKATDTDRFRRYTGGTKFVLHSARELIALYAKASDGGEPAFLVQEFIPGDDWMFDGYFDHNSQCLFGLTGKKIRRFPAKTGVTSLGICLPNETVEKTTTGFMKAIRYRGILDIGYRRDRRDGQYKVLDVNPRIGCTFRLFTSADGMDVARALYLNLTGQPVPPAQIVDGRKWIVEDFDLFSSLRTLMDGALKPKEWLGSLRGTRETACFAWDDPLPGLAVALADCCEMARWLRCRLRSRSGANDTQASPSSASAR